MSNVKRFEEFRKLNENQELNLDIRGHVKKIMNALYGMDEKYEDQVSTSFNEKTQEIKLSLDNEIEVENILSYLSNEGYTAESIGSNEILIKL